MATIDTALLTVRSLLDDETYPYLWNNADLISYFNRRLNEFALKTEYYTDSTTTAVCSISVTSASASYALDSRVIKVKRVMGTWDTVVPLRRRTVSWLDARRPGWQADAAGAPVDYIPDRTAGYLFLHPSPSTSGTLSLDVTRLPSSQLAITDIGKATPVTIEMPTMWMDNLYDGVLACAFAKPDSQTRNPQKEQYYFALWNAFLKDAYAHLDVERRDNAFRESTALGEWDDCEEG